MTASTAGRRTPAAKKAVPKTVAVNNPKPKTVAETLTEKLENSTILIHFVNDGLSAFGRTWLAGQELEVTFGTEDYSRTCDATGKSWLSLKDVEQVARYGKVMFKTGPSDIPNPIINYEAKVNPLEKNYKYPFNTEVTNFGNGWNSKAQLEEAAKKELARGRNVPRD